MTDALRRLVQQFIEYYSRSGGCSNCGGLPHTESCFVGRFQAALDRVDAGRAPQEEKEQR